MPQPFLAEVGGKPLLHILPARSASPNTAAPGLASRAAPGRGPILEAFHDDTSGQWRFTARIMDPLPFELVEQFVIEARTRLPGPVD